MISANRFTSDAKQIKYEVLRNVAALCFDGMFEEKKDDIRGSMSADKSGNEAGRVL